MNGKRQIFPAFYMTLVLIFLYIPIVVLVVFSFNKSSESVSWTGFTLEWYSKLFSRGDISKALVNTVIVSLVSTAVSIIFATLGAIGFYKYDFPGKKLIDGLFYVPAIVPAMLLGIALLSFYNIVGIQLSKLTIIIAHVTFCTPFAFTTIRGTMSGFDRSIEEAARDLGCGELGTIVKVIAPIIMPGIISATLLTFTISFEDVLTSFFVAGPGDSTLSMAIFGMIKKGVQPDLNALSTLLIIAAIILGVTAQITGGKKEKAA